MTPVAEDSPDEDQRRLTELIRQRLAEGSLPRFRGQRIYGGRGDGARCGCCDRPVGPDEIQYDVDQPPAGDDVTNGTSILDGLSVFAGRVNATATAAERSIPMHLACYRLWAELSEASTTTS